MVHRPIEEFDRVFSSDLGAKEGDAVPRNDDSIDALREMFNGVLDRSMLHLLGVLMVERNVFLEKKA